VLKKMLFILPVVLLLGAACTSGGEEPAARVADEAPSASATAPAGATEEPTEESGEALAGVMNPLGLLGGSFLGAGAMPSASEDVDPALKAALLQPEDLPPGYSSFGPLGMSFELSGEDLGLAGAEEFAMEMAMAYFSEGDMESGDFESMVASMVMVLPEEMMDEAIGGFEEFDEEALKEAQEAAPELAGLGFKEMSALDASGLGEDGVGMRMVLDLGGMGLGEIPGGEMFGGDLSFDMYMFVRGDKALMLVAMWPGGAGPGVDSRALAEIMDARAGEAF
jgi:hypothetical protein